MDDLIITAYRDLGVLCFDGIALKLFYVDPTSNTEFSRLLSTIKLHPSLPKSIKINRILPNANGSKVALVSEKATFLVNINEDFWAYCSVADTSGFNKLQSEYFSETELLHPNISLGKNPPTIRCCRWYRPSQISIHGPSRKCYFGILYSDNILRIYNAADNFDHPLVSIDFQALLFQPEENPRFRTAVGVGLNFQMTAFDFGPTFSRSDTALGSILATDSEGDLYFSVFNFEGMKNFAPVGPLRFKTKFRNALISDVCDMVLIQHPLSSTIPFENGENIFDVFIYDSLELPTPLTGTVSLHNENVIPGQYIVLNGNQVYTIDINPWLSDCYQMMTGRDNLNNMLPLSKQSMVRHVFMSLAPRSDKENIQPTTSQSSKTLSSNEFESNLIRCIASYESASASETISTKNVIFMAITNSGRLFVNTIRHSLLPSATQNFDALEQKQKILIKGPTLYDDILGMMPSKESFPVVSLEKFVDEDRLKIATNITKSLITKLNEKNLVLNETDNRVRQLIAHFSVISQSRVEIYKRLQNLLNAYAILKENLAQKRDSLKRMESRMDIASKRIVSTTAPLTEAQKEVLQRLGEIAKKLHKMTKENAQENMKILEERQQLMGSTKAFQASGRAQKFMLSKNSQEIARLTQSISKIDSTLSSL
uniref:Nuclear pore complex protein Nup88 n=1 Tax=Acrobeloides nanus TaxID=290746 RepID=A0A914DWM6_9BILA